MTTVARRHGIDAEHVKEVPGGVANRAFILGDDLFLRASPPATRTTSAKKPTSSPPPDWSAY
ncbi:hypothetical protein [Kribbella jiaozuonensis]|uniref:hypothetical protein n=1 Tax=Kribbella jiaozuonensis TaxID=2575441 RepID=UPI001F2A2A77|nr:hypothetical protein [Kribbella jiaozuonensis]